jgi:hypothetical protein
MQIYGMLPDGATRGPWAWGGLRRSICVAERRSTKGMGERLFSLTPIALGGTG